MVIPEVASFQPGCAIRRNGGRSRCASIVAWSLHPNAWFGDPSVGQGTKGWLDVQLQPGKDEGMTVNGMRAGHVRSMNSFVGLLRPAEVAVLCRDLVQINNTIKSTIYKMFIRQKSRSHSLQFLLCIELGLELSRTRPQAKTCSPFLGISWPDQTQLPAPPALNLAHTYLAALVSESLPGLIILFAKEFMSCHHASESTHWLHGNVRYGNQIYCLWFWSPS